MKNSGTGEILHFGATRFRVNGSGNLRLSLHSLDDIRSQSLVDLVMLTTTNREPVVLANFKEQRAQLELSTIEIDEVMIVSKIIIFIKPVETGYPQ